MQGQANIGERALTNVKVNRKTVLSEKEKQELLLKADMLPTEYFRKRAKAIVALLETGKRRSAVAILEKDDVKENGQFVYVTFTIAKKRKKKGTERPHIRLLQRTKKYVITSIYAQLILDYVNYMKKQYPDCKYLFPTGHVLYGESYYVNQTKPATPQLIWYVVKALSKAVWPHLWRETRGANVVKLDEKRHGEASLETVYRVKRALDLESETTAWRYVNRYATEKIESEDEILT